MNEMIKIVKVFPSQFLTIVDNPAMNLFIIFDISMWRVKICERMK